MNMIRIGTLIGSWLLLFTTFTHAQSIQSKIAAVEGRMAELNLQMEALHGELESLKLEQVRQDLQTVGLPTLKNGDQLVWHSSMALAYAEKFEQARWVAHMILPDVAEGTLSRTNDFRPDQKVTTGSAVEADYFLKYLEADNSYTYDGFGYDRGHLAPSADFRWSAIALSESFLYSNMSPQVADFNRGIWGNLENKIREYIYQKPGTSLFVVTGPVLENNLPKIEKGVNKVSIPKYYWKIVVDKERKRGIGFVMPNAPSDKPLELYAVSIDSVQKLTGLHFFTGLDREERDLIIKQRITADWFSEVASGDVEPVPIPELSRGEISTIMAANAMKSNTLITVVGKVVSGRVSRAGNVLLNLDKQYPNEIFTVFIKKEDIINFQYDPVAFLKGKRISVTGKVSNLGGKPVMYVSSQKSIEINEAMIE